MEWGRLLRAGQGSQGLPSASPDPLRKGLGAAYSWQGWPRRGCHISILAREIRALYSTERKHSESGGGALSSTSEETHQVVPPPTSSRPSWEEDGAADCEGLCKPWCRCTLLWFWFLPPFSLFGCGEDEDNNPFSYHECSMS